MTLIDLVPPGVKCCRGTKFTRKVFQDLKYTLRHSASRPWHTAFAIAALAIGIGANTGVFSVVNALLLRSLPFSRAGPPGSSA